MTRRDAIALVAVAVGVSLAAISAVHLSSSGSDRHATGARTPLTRTHDPRRSPVIEQRNAAEPVVRRAGIPTRVRIPALDVLAPVSRITSGGSGVLVPPADYTTVGWWADGARPGARVGTVILTGHTVHTGGGAFDNLDRMRPGQRVIVELRHKRALVYRVSSVSVFRKETLAQRAAAVFAQDARGRLALVTCEDWNGIGYLSNVVVLAAPVSAPTGVLRRTADRG